MMKKFTLILLLSVFGCFAMKAQTPLTTAVDFTATDCHGTTINLFEILDGGQFVLIDFFYTTCTPCQASVPKIKEAYEILGCNAHDIFFMEISPSDNNANCITWVNNYGIEYPTIGAQGGGSSINNTYGISAWPTIILIAPDRNIVIRDLWPINNANTIVSAVAPYGILPNDCPSNLAMPTNVEVVLDDNIVKLTWDAPAKNDLVGYNVYKDGELIAEEITDTEFSHECEGGTYEFCVSAVYTGGDESDKVCVDIEVIFCNHEIELRQTWLLVKAYGVLLTWEEIINIHSGEFVQYNIYRDGEIIDLVEENIYFDQDPPNETHTYMVSALYDDGCEAFSNEIEGEAGYIGIENYNSTFTIYPNPVNDYLNIETIEISNQYVEIYNFAGSLMIKEKINPQINVSSLTPGLYIIKIDNVKQKFIKQ